MTILIAALAAFAVLTALRAAQTLGAAPSMPSSYDTGRQGYAALYDFLRGQHVSVERFEDPLGELPAGGSLLVAGDGALAQTLAPTGAADALERWVRAGGTLIVLDGAQRQSRALGLPALHEAKASVVSSGCALAVPARSLRVAGDFGWSVSGGCGARRAALLGSGKRAYALAYRRGRGTVVYFVTPTPFDNGHLAIGDNAAFAYAVLSRGGTVAFDERVHGFARGASFWQVLPQSVRWAIVLACAGVLLALIGENLPFAPARPAQPPEERDSSAYIASVARMLERGGTSREIVAEVGEQIRVLLRRAHARDEVARNAMDELRSLESRYRPSASDVLQAGTLLARVRKEYES